MPTYDYECSKCGNIFEYFQGMNDAPLKKCPKCKGAVKRLIGCGTGVIFKGSGFYATDYKKKTESVPLNNAPAVCPKASQGCNGCGKS